MRARGIVVYGTKSAILSACENRATIILTLALSCTVFFVGPGCSRADDRAASAEILEQFQIRKGGRLITVPVMIGEKTYPFFIDTGCNMLVFDESLRELLGQKHETVLSSATGGNIALEMFDAPQCRLGKLNLRATRAACVGLRNALAPLGEDVYGVIGFNCLIDKVFCVDFDRGGVTFLAKATPQSGHRIPLNWTRNGDFLDGVYLLAEIGGLGTVKVLVDTGACGFRSGSVSKDLFQKMIEGEHAARVGPTRVEAIGPLGSAPTRIARIDRLSVGPFSHRGLLVSDLSPSQLGLGYLSRYIVTFDFPNKAIYLREGKDFSRTDGYGLGGLGLFAMDDKIVVGEVHEGGAADKAGLVIWDEIVQLDGIRASRTAIFDLCRALTEPGTKRVVFLRNNQRHEAALELVKLEPARRQGLAPAPGETRAPSGASAGRLLPPRHN